MKILLYPNMEKPNGLVATQKTVEKLLELSLQPMLDEQFRQSVGEREGCLYGRFSELLGRCDVLMPIGGDGTIMRSARHAAQAVKPILAVNAGRLGFLSQIEPHELDNLQLLIDGKYKIVQRMMLEAVLVQGGKPRRFTALNDVVISRSDADKIVDIHVHQGDRLITRHRADGLIFATATGSTAYSLSAGGPIVDPEMDLMLLTAICSHSTFNCSMVLPSKCAYTVTEKSAFNPKGLTISVDGRRIGKIHGEETVLVRKSGVRASFIDLGQRSFYASVNEKLSWGR